MYWTKECIGLRSCTDVVLKGLVPDLCIRGCVTCRIISGVKIVKDPLKYMPKGVIYIHICGYAHTCCKVSIHQAHAVYMRCIYMTYMRYIGWPMT